MNIVEKYVVGGAISALSYLFGGADALFSTLLTFMVLDYATGLLASGYEGKLHSTVGYKGIIKKIGILIAVIVAFKLDELGLEGLTEGIVPFEAPARTITILFYIGMEGISNIENLGRMGVPLPGFLIKGFDVLKNKGDKE